MLCVAFLIMSGTTLAANAPGAIVFVSYRSAVCYDLSTGQRFIVASNVDLCAIDPTGRNMVFTRGTNYLEVWTTPYVRQAVLSNLQQPNSTTFNQHWDNLYRRDKPYLNAEETRSLSVSPGNQPSFAFESKRKAMKWTLCPPGSEAYETLYNKGVPAEVRKLDLQDSLPRYASSWVERTSVDAFRVRGMPPRNKLESWSYGREQTDPSMDAYIYRPSQSHREMCYPKSIANIGSIQCGMEMVSGEELLRRKKEACELGVEDAHFPVWSSTLTPNPTELVPSPSIAVIHYTQNNGRWVDITISHPEPYLDRRFIRVSLKSCRGIAWTGDGKTVTYESGGKIFSEDGKVVVDGVDATRFFWTPDDRLLYRDSAGTLWIQKGGHREKLLDSVPEEFSYSRFSPFSTSSGNDRAVISKIGLGNCIDIGPMTIPTWQPTNHDKPGTETVRTCWQGIVVDRKSVYIATREPSRFPCDLSYAITEETDIQNIKNPGAYVYRKSPEPGYGLVPISVGRVLLLSNGKQYIAIKPVTVNKQKIVDRQSGTTEYYHWKEGTYMDFEWKYWPNAQSVSIGRAQSASRR